LIKSVFIQLRKDLTVEFRQHFALNVAVSFAAIVTISIGLSAGGIALSGRVHALLFWVILFFSAMNGLSHVFIREEEEETALFLRTLSPPEAVYAAKLVFNSLVLLAIGSIIAPLYIIFMGMEVRSPLSFALLLAAGCMAIASSTTLTGAMVAKAGGKGALFTILSFPAVLPVLWVSMKATALILTKRTAADSEALLFLLAFSIALIAVSYVLFEYVWAEE
jgi:heme exporter protein B